MTSHKHWPFMANGFVCWLASSRATFAAEWQALPSEAPVPANNSTTPAKVELGKMLYFDPRLSSTGTLSCFSCHNVMEGGDDHRPTSIGVHGQLGGRNAPTVWNAAFQSVQFSDGRAPSLEAQAKRSIVNPIEMGMPRLDLAVDRIKRIDGYLPAFQRAFGKGAKIVARGCARDGKDAIESDAVRHDGCGHRRVPRRPQRRVSAADHAAPAADAGRHAGVALLQSGCVREGVSRCTMA
jgi:cytochrome c peroxidase